MALIYASNNNKTAAAKRLIERGVKGQMMGKADTETGGWLQYASLEHHKEHQDREEVRDLRRAAKVAPSVRRRSQHGRGGLIG
jgi:hypothetical protein